MHSYCFIASYVRNVILQALLLGGCVGELPAEESPERYREPDQAPERTALPCDASDPAVLEGLEYRPSLVTRVEVANIVEDLFPSEAASDPELLKLAHSLPDAPVDETLDHTVFSANNLGAPHSQLQVLGLVALGERLADALVGQPQFEESCASADTCLEQRVLPLAERLWRGPLVQTEVDLLSSIMQDAEADTTENFRTALMTIFGSPRFYIKHRRLREGADDGSDLVHRFSFFLIDSLPDDDLYAAYRAGQIMEPSDLLDHVDRLLDIPKFARRFADRSVGAWLQYEPDIGSELPVDMGAEEPQSLGQTLLPLVARVQYAIAHDAPLSSIFEDNSRGSWFESRYFAHHTTHGEDTLVTDRGLYVARKLLCLPIPINEVDPELVATVLGPNPAMLNQLEVSEIRRATSACAGCHGESDKFGVALEHIDQHGNFRTNYEDGTPIAFEFDLGTTPVSSFDDFVRAFSSDPRLNTCFGRTLATKFTPLIRTSAQRCLDEPSFGGAHTIRDVVRRVVASPMFELSMKLGEKEAQ